MDTAFIPSTLAVIASGLFLSFSNFADAPMSVTALPWRLSEREASL
jgi:hypothetical protein